jgi:WD40 repeat protein
LRKFTQKKIAKYKRKEKIFTAKFSPNGHYLALAMPNGYVNILTIIRDKENSSNQFFNKSYIGFCKQGDCIDVVDIGWTTNSKLIMVLTLDKQLTLWSLEARCIVQTMKYNEIPTCVHFHP